MKVKCIFAVRFDTQNAEPYVDSCLFCPSALISRTTVRLLLGDDELKNLPSEVHNFAYNLKLLMIRARFNMSSVYCIEIDEEFAKRELIDSLVKSIPAKDYPKKFDKIF